MRAALARRPHASTANHHRGPTPIPNKFARWCPASGAQSVAARWPPATLDPGSHRAGALVIGSVAPSRRSCFAHPLRTPHLRGKQPSQQVHRGRPTRTSWRGLRNEKGRGSNPLSSPTKNPKASELPMSVPLGPRSGAAPWPTDDDLRQPSRSVIAGGTRHPGMAAHPAVFANPCSPSKGGLDRGLGRVSKRADA